MKRDIYTINEKQGSGNKKKRRETTTAIRNKEKQLVMIKVSAGQGEETNA